MFAYTQCCAQYNKAVQCKKRQRIEGRNNEHMNDERMGERLYIFGKIRKWNEKIERNKTQNQLQSQRCSLIQLDDPIIFTNFCNFNLIIWMYANVTRCTQRRVEEEKNDSAVGFNQNLKNGNNKNNLNNKNENNNNFKF